MLVVSVTVWAVIQHQVDELADAGLQESAELLYGLMLTLDEPMQASMLAVTLPAPAHTEKVIWQRIANNGTLMLRSHHAPETPFFSTATPGMTNINGVWRVFGLPLPGEKGMVYVADHQSERRRARWDATWAAVAITVMMGLGLVAWSRQRIGRELAPLLVLSQALATYDPSRPKAKLPRVHRQELQPIRKSVIALGRRLSQRIDNERSFSAHAAHALRTPLAGMDAQLAVALRDCPDDMRPRLTQAREAANRLKRVVSSLLTLFRTGIEVRWQSVNIAALLAKVNIQHLEVEVLSPSDVEADPDLLAAALINLLDNVVLHGGTQVTVHVQIDTRFQVISLQDNGPGVHAERLQELQHALARKDYSGHTGLGLMMADMVARAHGGALTIANREVGLSADMTLRHQPRA
ncbi:MAG: two-component sensor histidine kinase [Polaromonas sp.]|nr:two-component sensor histidine kinase [Polaromonas sp.]